jgi:hypothetical protein
MVCALREEHPNVLAVRVEAAVLREKRIEKDDVVVGLVAHDRDFSRPVLARLPGGMSGEPPRERTHAKSLRRRTSEPSAMGCARVPGMTPERVLRLAWPNGSGRTAMPSGEKSSRDGGVGLWTLRIGGSGVAYASVPD